MKLCFLLPAHWSGTLGGAELQVKYLMDVLRARGSFEMSYVCRHATQASDAGTPVYRVVHNHRLARFTYSIDFLQIRTFLREIAPDVIYARTDSPYLGIAAHYCRNKPCRLIWHIAHQRDVEPYKLRGPKSFPRFIDRKVFEYGVRRADVVVGQARYQDELLRQNFGRSCADIIPNFHPEAKTIDKPKQPITVVWIANIKPAKRPESFIELAAALRHRTELKFVMIGAVQDRHWADKLQREISQFSNLEYLGALPIEEANDVLASSHIFVNTSDAEGFPNTFIQAWLRKTVVVSLSIDPDNLLARDRYGYLSGNTTQLAADVLHLASHELEREEVAARSYRYALDTFSLDNAERLASLFQ